MTNQPRQGSNGTAGGVFIALLTLIGVFVGGIVGQPSIGLITGFAVGAGIALAMWLKQRGR